jgi:signal transduction histidine kinase
MVSDSHRIIKEYENIPETVFADRHRIEQVLINLLTNAIKYSPGNDHIVVSLYKTYQSLVVRIRDFGKGIPKSEQKSVFERFYRSKDTSARIAGFGLGLYISKDIINRHQGEIWVESDSSGSAFFFSLPIFKKQIADDNKPANEALFKKPAD